MALEKARAKVVLPTPGLSSSRMWPRAKMAMSTLHTTASFPRMALRTSFTTASALGCSINVPLFQSRCPRGGRILILHRLERCFLLTISRKGPQEIPRTFVKKDEPPGRLSPPSETGRQRGKSPGFCRKVFPGKRLTKPFFNDTLMLYSDSTKDELTAYVSHLPV